MRKMLLALLLVVPSCVAINTSTISGHWRSTEFGGNGDCYETLGGEDVHIDVHTSDTTISRTQTCADNEFAIEIPTGSTNVVVDVYGDGNDHNTHRVLGTVTSDVDLGSCNIDSIHGD